MKHLTPLRSIRRHCLSCAGRPKDVRLCNNTECNLFQYRMGKNPARARIGGSIGQKRPCFRSGMPNSAQDSRYNHGGKRKYMPLGVPRPKLANNGRIALSGRGVINIKNIGKDLVKLGLKLNNLK